jgi:hypothetical protein
VALLHRLGPAGTLEAVVEGAKQLALRRPPGGEVEVAWVSPGWGSSVTCVPGLAPGPWELCAPWGSQGRHLLPLATFEVRAGETTLVEVREGPVVVEGVCVRGGAPLAGCRGYDLSGGYRLTGADGVIAHRPAGPLVGFVSFSVEAPEPDSVRLDWRFPPMGERDERWRGTLEVPAGAFSVRCLDASGRPAAGVTLDAGPAPPPSSSRHGGASPRVGGSAEPAPTVSGGRRTSDAEGRASWSGAPSGLWLLSASFPGGVGLRREIEVGDGSGPEVVLRAYAPGRVRATVLDPEGRPAPRVRVVAVPLDGDDEAPGIVAATAFTDDGGVALVEGVRPGSVRLFASVPVSGPFARGARSPEADVSVREGAETEVSLALEPPR